MNKVLEYIIAAKDNTADAVNSAWGRVKSFASGVLGQMANIKAGLEMAWGVAQKFGSIFGTAIKEAFKFEKAQSDFAGLLNSVDKAKEHIADLRKFASSTPLTFDDLSQASKLLLSFGMNVEEVMPSMKMLGDIAMGDSQKFQGLSLVFAQVKSAGKLMGQDLMQMINQGFNPLTVIAKETGKSMSELKDMMGEGSISFEMVAEAMRVATSEGGLFNDAMANAAQTGEGLMSTLSDKWTDVVRTFGEAFTDTAKGGIHTLIDKITQLVDDGTVDVWANKVAKALNGIVDVAKDCAGAIGKVVSAYNSIRNFGEKVGSAVGGFVGALTGGGTLSDAFASAGEQVAQTDIEQNDKAAEDAAEEARIRAKASARASAAEEDAISKGVSEKKIEQAKSLAKMVAEAETNERVKAEKKIAKERDKLMSATVKQYTQEVSEWQKKNASAQERLSSSKSKVEELWSIYEDDDKYYAYVQNQQQSSFNKQKAQMRFNQDYARLNELGGNYLSDNLAREMADALSEQNAAEEYARQTAEQTAEAVKKLEQINATLSGGRLE